MKKIIVYINIKSYHIITNTISTYDSKWIKDGQITSASEFIKEFKYNNNKDKQINKVLPFNLIIFLNKEIEEEDDIYYKYVFDEFNIQNFQVKSINEIVKNKEYIIVSKNNYIIINSSNVIKIPKEHLKLPKNKEIYILGELKINSTFKKIFFISNYEEFFANKIKNIA